MRLRARWVWSFVAVVAMALYVGSPLRADDIAPDARICHSSTGDLVCPNGQVCDPSRAMCVPEVVAEPGFKRCADGLTTCPLDRDCNMEGEGSYRCLAPGAMRCELPRAAPAPGERAAGNLFWCEGGKVCDIERAMCVERATATPGHKVCGDGLTVCPEEQECNQEARDSFRCLVPGSTRCDLPGGTLWCLPGKVCDVANGKCSDPVAVPEGHKLCSDGLSTCPQDQDCNMEGEGAFRCLVRGSTRCDLPGPAPLPGERAAGNVLWCAPGKVCNAEAARCDNPPLAAGMVARIEGSWTMICNEYTGSPVTPAGNFHLDVPRKRGLGYTVTGRMNGGSVGDIGIHGQIYTSSVLKDQVRFSQDEGAPHSIGLFGPWSMDGDAFVVSGEINASLAGGLTCRGTFQGRSN